VDQFSEGPGCGEGDKRKKLERRHLQMAKRKPRTSVARSGGKRSNVGTSYQGVQNLAAYKINTAPWMRKILRLKDTVTRDK